MRHGWQRVLGVIAFAFLGINGARAQEQVPSPQVVGESGGRAVLWEREPPEDQPDAPHDQWQWKQKDLTDLVPEGSLNGRLTQADDINDLGTIIGRGVRDDGTEFGYLLLPVEMSITPDEPRGTIAGLEDAFGVSADEAQTYLQVNVFVPGKDEDGNPAVVPVDDGTLIEWELLDGSSTGSFDAAQSVTTDGYASVKLTTSHTPGDLYKVKAKIVKLIYNGKELSSPTGAVFFHTESAVIEVVPGRAKDIAVTVSDGSSLPADGVSETTLTATVKDERGALVAEGTDVYWHVKGLGRLEDVQTNTDANGQVTARLIAGTIPGDQTVEIEADGTTHTEVITNSLIGGEASGAANSLDMALGAGTTITANFVDAADDAEVTWFTTKGQIVNATTTVQGGQAQATLQTTGATRLGDSLVFAAVGGSVKMATVDFTSSDPITVATEEPVIVGDATTDGTVDVEKLDGTMETIAYPASTNVTISAPSHAGQVATVSLGAIEPAQRVTFGFDAENGGTTQDASGVHTITFNGATLNTVTQRSGAGSLQLDGQSATATLPSSQPFLASSNGFAVDMWVYPVAGAGTILAKSGEYSLSFNGQGQPVFALTTDTGTHSVTATEALPLEQWSQVRGAIEPGGRLTLTVNGAISEATFTGSPIIASSAIVFGTGFHGELDDLRFTQGRQLVSSASAPWTVSGLNPDGTVTLDSQGKAVFTMTGAGSISDPAHPHGRSVSVRVSINPETTAEDTVAVVSKSEYAVISAMTGSLQVTTGGQVRALTDEERAEVVARHLNEFLQSGQRAAAVTPFSAATLPANGQRGFRVAVWMEETTNESGEVGLIMRKAVDGLGPEATAQLNNQLAELMSAAADRDDDISFQDYINQNAGPLIASLQELSEQPPEEQAAFQSLAEAIDGEQTWTDARDVADIYGPLVVDDLAQVAAEEELPPDFIQRTLSYLVDALPDNIVVEWKDKAFNGAEDWLRQHLADAVVGGRIDAQAAAGIGYFWGLAQLINQTGSLAADPTAGAKMMAELSSLVIRAATGDEEAQGVLLELLPIYGTFRDSEEAFEKWEAGEYFDSGIVMFQGTLGVVGDVTLVSGLSIKAVRLLRKLNKALDPVRNWTRPGRNLTPAQRAALVGKASETWASNMLRRRGYDEIIPLQNRSNQGIDLLAKKRLATGDEVWVHVEVKGHWQSGPFKLRGPQKSRVQFVESRLRAILDNKGNRWNDVSQEVLDSAQRALDAIIAKRPIHGFGVNVNYGMNWFPGQRGLPGINGFPGPRGEVWYWPRNPNNKPWHPGD